MDIFDNESTKIAEGVVEQLKAENAELKRLLRLAMDTIKLLNDKLDLAIDDTSCWCCFKHICGCAECMMKYDGSTCKWKHADEAMKLLGDKCELE